MMSEPDILFELPNDKQAITLYRQWEYQKQSLDSDEEKQAFEKKINKARQKLVAHVEELFLLEAVNGPVEHEKYLWFWFNHFNVFWYKGLVGAALPDYLQTIRRYSQGSFKEFLRAIVKHPAMLVYLDNVRNTAKHINENYARELLELHTLGVNGGYSQHDVSEVARLLTGVGLKSMEPLEIPAPWSSLQIEQDEFFFNPQHHDRQAKQILGQTIHAKGFDEIEQLIDLLCGQSATARYLCTKLAVLEWGDYPEPAIINQATEVFLSTHGNLADTVQTIKHYPVSKPPLPSFKTPYDYVLSAVRLLSHGQSLKNAKPLIQWLRILGQPLFACATPNGYSFYGYDWLNANQMIERFAVAQNMVERIPQLTRNLLTIEAIIESPAVEQYIASLSVQSQKTLSASHSTQERLALLLSTPEFMYR